MAKQIADCAIAAGSFGEGLDISYPGLNVRRWQRRLGRLDRFSRHRVLLMRHGHLQGLDLASRDHRMCRGANRDVKYHRSRDDLRGFANRGKGCDARHYRHVLAGMGDLRGRRRATRECGRLRDRGLLHDGVRDHAMTDRMPAGADDVSAALHNDERRLA